MSIEAMKLALEALENWLEFDPENFGATDNRAVTAIRQAIEQAEEKNCKNCVIDKPCIAKGKDMQICGAFVPKHAKELKQIALDKKAENARELGLDYEPAQAEKQEPVALETVYQTIIHWDEGGGKRSRRELARRIVALYTTPQPQREWVGLTDEEIKHAPHHMVDGAYHYSFKQGAEWAEVKLRSKNT